MESVGFFEKIDRKDWRNAIIGGIAVGFVPMVGTAVFMLHNNWPILDHPLAACVGGLVLLLIGAMFGATAAAITLVFSVFIRQWPSATRHLVGAYEDFAREFGGELFLNRPPRLFQLFGPSPQRVVFSRRGTKVLLEIVADGIGDNTYVYTDLTFHDVDVGDFACEVYPAGTMSRLGEYFGVQDVQLGHRDLDERFIVKASDALRAREVLNEPFRIGMQELASWAETVRDRSEQPVCCWGRSPDRAV